MFQMKQRELLPLLKKAVEPALAHVEHCEVSLTLKRCLLLVRAYVSKLTKYSYIENVLTDNTALCVCEDIFIRVMLRKCF